jgi:two-component system nitrogen regulation sensor histidine kinase NtrY
MSSSPASSRRSARRPVAKLQPRADGSGFGEIGKALDEGIRAARERHRLTDSNRFYEAVLDDAPTPLLTVDSDGRVELTNKAARRLFVRHDGVRIEDFREYGEAFAKALAEMRSAVRGSCR